MKLIKETNQNLTEEQLRITKEKIQDIKLKINQKLKEDNDEILKEKEAKHKNILSSLKSESNYRKEKVKKKQISGKCYLIELKIVNESLKKKAKLIFEELKSVAPNISDCRPASNDMVKVKLTHQNKDKLITDIQKLGSFEVKK